METPKEAVATGLFDDIEPAPNQEFTAYNVLDDHSIQMKLHEIEQKNYIKETDSKLVSFFLCLQLQRLSSHFFSV
ncbi:hypothetical protein GCM10020331_051140 [Ectobacillus funiculus]